MNGRPGRRLLNDGIAMVLRFGTVVTVGLIAAGYAVAVAGEEDPGPLPMADMLADGGGTSLIGVGMLGLTLVPVLVLVVAAVGLHRLGERRSALVSVLVAVLLVSALAVASALRAG